MSFIHAESTPLPMRSSYYPAVKWFCDNHQDHSETLSKIESAEQVTKLGKALECAGIDWEHGKGKQSYGSEMECLQSYFSAAWEVLFGRSL